MAAIFRHIFVNSSLIVHILVYVSYTIVEELSIVNNLIYYTRLLDNWLQRYRNLKSKWSL